MAVDLRGYGDSDKPPRGYDLWTLAGDVAGLVPALGEDRAAIVGHGWGGVVGWTVAALHPRRVNALVGAWPRRTRWRSGGRSCGSRAARAGRSLAVAGFQLPRWPERVLRAGDGVERIHARVGRAPSGRPPRTSATRSRATGRRRASPARRTARWSTTGGRCGRSCGPRAAGSRSPSPGPRRCRCWACTAPTTRGSLARHRCGVGAVGGATAHRRGPGGRGALPARGAPDRGHGPDRRLPRPLTLARNHPPLLPRPNARQTVVDCGYSPDQCSSRASAASSKSRRRRTRRRTSSSMSPESRRATNVVRSLSSISRRSRR